eukprot:COSAG04_NODE_18417_length_442_cov_0.807580_1_plen_59_part_00
MEDGTVGSVWGRGGAGKAGGRLENSKTAPGNGAGFSAAEEDVDARGAGGDVNSRWEGR